MDPKNIAVQKMFDGITPTYDLLNHLLSLGQDYWWRRVCVKSLPEIGKNQVILDLCCGSGDLTLELFYRYSENPLIALDFSRQMLNFFQKKIRSLSLEDMAELTYCQGNGELLPLKSESIALVTCAFGVRNFSDRRAGLFEIYRVLKPGGVAAILELGLPEATWFRHTFLGYFEKLCPLFGKFISGDSEAYTYLPRSVRNFPKAKNFKKELVQVGFQEVRSISLTFGITRLFLARKL